MGAMTEGVSGLQIVVGLMVQLALPLGLFAWGRSIARTRPGTVWKVLAVTPLLAAVAALAGLLGTIVGLTRAFGSLDGVDPSGRASALSDGIATAMWSTAVGLGVAVSLYVVCIVAFAFGQWGPRAPADHHRGGAPTS